MSTAVKLRILEKEQEVRDVSDLAGEAAEYWESNLDTELKDFHIRELFSWYGVGFEHELIVAAMTETFKAPAPSWRYLDAIIKRCEAERVKTFEAWKGRKGSKEKRRENVGGVKSRVQSVAAALYGTNSERRSVERQIEAVGAAGGGAAGGLATARIAKLEKLADLTRQIDELINDEDGRPKKKYDTDEYDRLDEEIEAIKRELKEEG